MWINSYIWNQNKTKFKIIIILINSVIFKSKIKKQNKVKKKEQLKVQCLGRHAFTPLSPGSTLGQGTKIPQAKQGS